MKIESSESCMHTCAPVTHITFPLWWVQVSVTSRGWKRIDEFRHGAWEPRRFWRGGLDGLLLAGWYTVFGACTNISPHVPELLQEKACRTVWQHMLQGCFTFESLIMGWLGCIGSPDNWFSPWEKGQGTGNMLLRNGEQEWDGQSDLDNPRLAWQKTKSFSARTVRQHREGIRMT